MYKNNLRINLEPREDKNKNIFYIGRLRAPISVNLNEGVTFLVFLSEDDAEELQIAPNDNENAMFSKFSRQPDRLKINLEPRVDRFDKKYYIAKISYNGIFHCKTETVFMIYVSKQGSEELQIIGNLSEDGTVALDNKGVEVIQRSRSYSRD